MKILIVTALVLVFSTCLAFAQQPVSPDIAADRREEMRRKLAANGYRISTLVETIVTSPQFLTKRGTS